MLKQLTDLIEQANGNVSLSQLSQELGASPSAVAGMLEFLVQKGRLSELDSECGVCTTCSLESRCTLPAVRARRYRTN